MTILIVILLAIGTPLAWLLWMPMRIELNTLRGIFKVEWRNIASMKWLPEGEFGALEIKAPFYRKIIPMEKLWVQEGKPKAVAPPKAPAKAGKRPPFSLKALLRLLKTIHIRYFRIYWDTDDFMMNSWLFPVFGLLRRKNAQVIINYQGMREVVFLIEMRPGSALWAFLQSFTFKKS